jgi:hypothetical protein
MNGHEHITALAKLWMDDAQNFLVSPAMTRVADAAVDEFIDNPIYPLIVRCKGTGRGSVLRHEESGRNVIFADNSPAHWLYHRAATNLVTSSDDIFQALKEHRLPIAFVHSKHEASIASYLGKGPVSGFSERDLVLCHFEDVSVRRGKIDWQRLSEQEIRRLSRRFLRVSNMFVVPKREHYAQSLGENVIFRRELRELFQLRGRNSIAS